MQRDVGGPGLVNSGGFVGGGFGVTGAIEGMAIATVLNGLTARTSIKTIMRIQGTGCGLFLLHTRATPDQLRIEMSRTLSGARTRETARTSATFTKSVYKPHAEGPFSVRERASGLGSGGGI